MTEEQKTALNVGLATWEGWTCVNMDYGMGLHPSRKVADYTVSQVLAGNVPLDIIPNYCDDLNAINRLEERLTDEEWEDYIIRLKCVCNGMDYHAFQWPALGFDAYALRDIVHASAEQRAIAMAKTLNLNIEGL